MMMTTRTIYAYKIFVGEKNFPFTVYGVDLFAMTLSQNTTITPNVRANET